MCIKIHRYVYVYFKKAKGFSFFFFSFSFKFLQIRWNRRKFARIKKEMEEKASEMKRKNNRSKKEDTKNSFLFLFFCLILFWISGNSYGFWKWCSRNETGKSKANERNSFSCLHVRSSFPFLCYTPCWNTRRFSIVVFSSYIEIFFTIIVQRFSTFTFHLAFVSFCLPKFLFQFPQPSRTKKAKPNSQCSELFPSTPQIIRIQNTDCNEYFSFFFQFFNRRMYFWQWEKTTGKRKWKCCLFGVEYFLHANTHANHTRIRK